MFVKVLISVMKNYTLTIVFRNDGMLAVTFSETVKRDLTLVKCLSVWKENKENPLMFMTGSCVFFFFVCKSSSKVSFEPSVILGRIFVAENYK